METIGDGLFLQPVYTSPLYAETPSPESPGLISPYTTPREAWRHQYIDGCLPWREQWNRKYCESET